MLSIGNAIDVQKSGQQVEVGSLSHSLRGVFIHPKRWWSSGFLNHQQYSLPSSLPDPQAFEKVVETQVAPLRSLKTRIECLGKKTAFRHPAAKLLESVDNLTSIDFTPTYTQQQTGKGDIQTL